MGNRPSGILISENKPQISTGAKRSGEICGFFSGVLNADPKAPDWLRLRATRLQKLPKNSVLYQGTTLVVP
jgi:hypothetical protein